MFKQWNIIDLDLNKLEYHNSIQKLTAINREDQLI